MLTKTEIAVLRYLGAPDWQDTLANRITIWRTRISVAGALSCYAIARIAGALQWHEICAVVLSVVFAFFVANAFLDWLDGWCARRQKGVSAFGRFIDPLGDKFSNYAAYFIVASWHFQFESWLIPMLASLIYDKYVMRLRRENDEMRTNWFAKFKQAAIFVGMAAFTYHLAGEVVSPNEWIWRDSLISASYLGAGAMWTALPLMGLSAMYYYSRTRHLVAWMLPRGFVST